VARESMLLRLPRGSAGGKRRRRQVRRLSSRSCETCDRSLVFARTLLALNVGVGERKMSYLATHKCFQIRIENEVFRGPKTGGVIHFHLRFPLISKNQLGVFKTTHLLLLTTSHGYLAAEFSYTYEQATLMVGNTAISTIKLMVG
jgi:hypothetical protein